MHLCDGFGRQIFSLSLQSFPDERYLLQKRSLLLIRKLDVHSDLASIGLCATGLTCLHLHGTEESTSNFSGAVCIGTVGLDVGACKRCRLQICLGEERTHDLRCHIT